MQNVHINYFLCLLIVLLSLISSISFATNPASKQYVDEKAAALQAQLTGIQNNLALKIGQQYGGGTIIYLDNGSTPRRGLIAAPTDAVSVSICGGSGEFCLWDVNPVGAIPSAEGTLLFDGGPLGNNNTQAIIAAIGTTKAQAAFAARSYTTAGDTNCSTATISCTGWYLPSASELELLFIFGGPLGGGVLTGFTNNPSDNPNYWSSSQDSNTSMNAWITIFGNGAQGPANKQTSTVRVRAVRAFTY